MIGGFIGTALGVAPFLASPTAGEITATSIVTGDPTTGVPYVGAERPRIVARTGGGARIKVK